VSLSCFCSLFFSSLHFMNFVVPAADISFLPVSCREPGGAGVRHVGVWCVGKQRR
jgi:hypothetical protein